MIKKILLGLLFAALVLSFSPAKAESRADQACTPESTSSDFMGINLNENRAYQLFSPTKDTFDSVELFLGTTNSGTVKAKVSIIFVQDATGLQRGAVLDHKYISVTGTQFVNVDFNDFPLEDGIYSIKVEAVHDNEIVYWPVTEGNCYPGGYAIVNDQVRVDWDFFFIVIAYNSAPTPEEGATNPGGPPSTASSSTGLNSSTTISTPPATPIKNLPSDSQKVDKNLISSQTSTTNLSGANQKSAAADRLNSDKALQEEIALLLKQLEEEKKADKDGAFGLQGVVGDFLTWPVFYGLCGVILLLIIIFIVRAVKKRSASAPPPQHPVNKSS